jgi:hypothetical protein
MAVIYGFSPPHRPKYVNLAVCGKHPLSGSWLEGVEFTTVRWIATDQYP